jgi:hypothetical protein
MDATEALRALYERFPWTPSGTDYFYELYKKTLADEEIEVNARNKRPTK